MLRNVTRVAALALLVPAVAAGQQTPLTLEDAVAQVLAQNPAVRAARAGEEAAAARVREARAGFLPRIDLVEGWDRGNQPVFVFGSLLSQQRFSAANFDIASLNRPDPLTNHRFAAAVEQTVFDGSRTRAEHSVAAIGAELAKLESELTALDLRLEAVRAFGRASRTAAAARSARAAVESAAEDLRRVTARRDSGLETEAQVLAMRVRLSEAEAHRVQTEEDERVARAALNAVMGAPLDRTIVLADLPLPATDSPNVPALERFALEHHPNIRQAILRERQADFSRTAARAGFLPHVLVHASAESNGGSFDARETTWTAGVQVRWRVFAGGADAARVRAAAAAITRTSAERERIVRAIQLDVRSAAAAYASARAREEISAQMIEQAVESRRMVRERYDAGLASSVELARAGELVVRADATRIAAIVDVHVTAATLDRAVGSAEGTR